MAIDTIMNLPNSSSCTSIDNVRDEIARSVLALDAGHPQVSHKIASIFHTAFERLQTAGAEDAELTPLLDEVRFWIIQPFSGMQQEREKTEKPIALSERFAQHEERLRLLSSTARAHFEARFHQSHNPLVRARYADYLGVYAAGQASDRNEVRKWVLEAVPAYLENASLLAPLQEFDAQMQAINSLDSSAHLASSVAPDQLMEVVRALLAHLQTTSQEITRAEDGGPLRRGRWAADSGWILVNLASVRRNAVSDSDLSWWQNLAQELAEYNSPLGEPGLEQAFWLQAVEVARLRGQENEKLALWYQYVQSQVREARARTQGAGASFAAGAGLMERAIKSFERLLSSVTDEATRLAYAEEQRQLKLEMRHLHEQAKSEFGVVRTHFKVSNEALEEAIAPILEPVELSECLSAFGRSFLPMIEEAEQFADDEIHQNSIMSVVGIVVAGEGHSIRNYTTEEEKRKYRVERELDRFLALYSRLVFPIIWERLRSQKGLNPETLMDYLRNSGIVRESRVPLIQKGIEHYFSSDFISALHLLVPQLEDMIRHLFELMGLPPTKPSASANGWEYETFGALLRRMDTHLPGVLPPELRFYVERILCEPTGLNLRNEIAHGLIDTSVCNPYTAGTVLHLYVVFCGFANWLRAMNSESK